MFNNILILALFILVNNTWTQECHEISKVGWWGLDSIRPIPNECETAKQYVDTCKSRLKPPLPHSVECEAKYQFVDSCGQINDPKYYQVGTVGLNVVCDSIIRSWALYDVGNINFQIRFNYIPDTIWWNGGSYDVLWEPDSIIKYISNNESTISPIFDNFDIYNGFANHCFYSDYETGHCFQRPAPSLNILTFNDILNPDTEYNQGYVSISAKKEEFLNVLNALSSLSEVEGIIVNEVYIPRPLTIDSQSMNIRESFYSKNPQRFNVKGSTLPVDSKYIWFSTIKK